MKVRHLQPMCDDLCDVKFNSHLSFRAAVHTRDLDSDALPLYSLNSSSSLYLLVLTMKFTGAAVLGMVASTQAFHVPMRTKLGAATPARASSTSLNAALTDAEVRAAL